MILLLLCEAVFDIFLVIRYSIKFRGVGYIFIIKLGNLMRFYFIKLNLKYRGLSCK